MITDTKAWLQDVLTNVLPKLYNLPEGIGCMVEHSEQGLWIRLSRHPRMGQISVEVLAGRPVVMGRVGGYYQQLGTPVYRWYYADLDLAIDLMVGALQSETDWNGNWYPIEGPAETVVTKPPAMTERLHAFLIALTALSREHGVCLKTYDLMTAQDLYEDGESPDSWIEDIVWDDEKAAYRMR